MENPDKQFVIRPAWLFPYPSFPLFYPLLLSSVMEAEAKLIFGGIALRGSFQGCPTTAVPEQLLHPLLHHHPQARECQQKCVKPQEKTAFCSLFQVLSKPQECGGARGPQAGGERAESEEEEEEALGWFPPALEANLSLQDGTRQKLQ